MNGLDEMVVDLRIGFRRERFVDAIEYPSKYNEDDDTENELAGRLKHARKSIVCRLQQPPIDVGASYLNTEPIHSMKH